ncbi:MAG: EamA family transporter [Sneathiella sp.]|uniref:EamA family transporter n=1 Tax=Sneathiella sp. TaxID=1964365 RepID=UPI003002D7F7
MGDQAETALYLVLGAAFLHAFWNALIKGSTDSTLVLGLISLAHALVGVVMIFLFLPPAAESWPFIAASTFIHFFYYVFLLRSYRFGDLSHVYPISRGVAPVLVTLGAQVFAGETLPLLGWIGVVMVSLGVSMPSLKSGLNSIHPKALISAIATGIFIASYTVVDGMGVRASASPFGYIGWLFFLEFIVAGFVFYRRRYQLQLTSRTVWSVGFIGGIASAGAYGLAIYAKSIAPLGAVSAVRESSVVIAALIGIIWFHERPWKIRLISAGIVACGVLVLSKVI